MKLILIVLRAVSALANLLPYKASSKVQGLCEALAAPIKAFSDKAGREEAQRIYDEIESNVKVAQAKRAEPVEKP
jgi:hypothetical protein